MVAIGDETPEGGLEPAASPQLGFGAKFWNLFVDPRKTFQSVGRNHEWVILWLLVAVISIGGYLPIKPIVKDAQLEAVEERLDQNPQITPEQRAQIMERVSGQFDNPWYLLFVPASQLVILMIVSGVLLFLGNIVLGGNTGFLRMLNAYAWTGLVALPATIILVPMMMAKGSMDVSLGLGVLTSAETGAFVKKLLTSFEVFGIWQVTLSGIAVSVLAGVGTKKALWSVFIAWLIWVIAQSGLAAIGIQFGM